MSASSQWIIVAALAATLSGCSPYSDLSGPPQLQQILATCETVTFTGCLPLMNKSGGQSLVTMEFTLQQRKDIDRLAAFLRDSHPTPDSVTTDKLRDGAVFATKIHADVVIDNHWRFRVLSSSLMIFAHDACFRCAPNEQADGFFALDLATLLSQIRVPKENSR